MKSKVRKLYAIGDKALESMPDLATAVNQGIDGATSALVAKYGASLRSLLRVRISDPQQAEDVFQDTFLVVIKRLKSKPLNDPSKLAHFINRTAINLHIGVLRKHERRNTHADQNAIANTADRSLSPLAQTLHDERRHAVRQLLSELDHPRDRNVLERFYINDLDKKTICDEFELSSTNFDCIISRARQRFRKLIEEKAPQLKPHSNFRGARK